MKILNEEILDRMPTGNGYYHQYTPINPAESLANDTPEGIRHPPNGVDMMTTVNDLFNILFKEYK